MKFNIKISDLELQSCGDNLLTEGVNHNRAAIVKLNDDNTKFVIASWTKHKQGFDLEFVGDRPLKVDPKDFMELAKIGQILLDDNFDKI